MSANSRQTGKMANNELFAVIKNCKSEECCELPDKIISLYMSNNLK
jgi:hypothetical protein